MMSSNSYPQPFAGAPPIPQGYNVPPSQWNTGVWQRNPRYNSLGVPTQIPQAVWVPGAAWGQPQQQQQQYNPYKRHVNPPSAAYLSQKLSDNPLGLSNMITREELYGPGVDGAPPETPWIWNPRSLDDANSNSKSNQFNNNARQSSEPPVSVSHRPQSQSVSRHASEPPPDNYQNHQERAIAPLARPKKYAVSASAQAASAPAQGSQPQPPATSSASAYALSRAAAAATSTSADDTASDAPYSSATPTRPFRPTFSTRIVRTPDHYRHDDNDTPSNGNPNSSLTRSATMPSSTGNAGQNHTTPARSRSQSTSHARDTSADSTVGPSTGTGTITDASVFVDEPGTLLSPLVMNTPMPPTSKPLGRHHTAPALSTIQEQTSPSERHHHHHSSHRQRSSSRHPESINSTPSKSRSSSNSKTSTPGASAPGESNTNTNYFSLRNNATGGTSSASAAAASASRSQSQPQTTPPNQSNAASLFGNRTPNPLPTPPRVFDMNHPSYSRANMYTPPTGIGSSSTIAYTTPVSAPAHGSSTTTFGVISSSAGISSASASASAQAQASRSSRSRPQSRDDTRDREPVRESPSRVGAQQERSHSRAHSGEPSYSREPSRSRGPSREPSREPVARRLPDRFRDSDNPYPFIAPDGTPPVEQGPEFEARVVAELATKYNIRGEPPKSRQRYQNGSGMSAPAVSSAPATTTTFERFPLPTPPESFLEQRRQEARKEEERLKKEKEAREREQQQQQQYSYHQSASSYQTPKTSPYNDNTNRSPQRSPSYAPQHSSASRQSSPYPSPNNATQQRSSPYPSPNNNVTATQRSPYPSPSNAPQRSPYPSPYSNASSTQPSPRPSPPKHSHHAFQGGRNGTNSGHRIRKGYWNSRGDHLTHTGYIVYAPPEEANPPELESYPGQWSGFQDEYGNIAKFEVGRKELPESLPTNGRSPKRPYDICQIRLVVLKPKRHFSCIP
ncbi:hypothetical protein J3R30DRAFT_1602531 [Lentinula aciculospora]|uniref:Uncharacterized protein n=1 Tax=Lentinula aciculospora TaxID=153920 RepID=A0A9W8ZYL6_9AGAR|nr:hypothetical protein J3R30DRAFT_1602531 [Lentinula aciculospora]